MVSFLTFEMQSYSAGATTFRRMAFNITALKQYLKWKNGTQQNSSKLNLLIYWVSESIYYSDYFFPTYCHCQHCNYANCHSADGISLMLVFLLSFAWLSTDYHYDNLYSDECHFAECHHPIDLSTSCPFPSVILLIIILMTVILMLITLIVDQVAWNKSIFILKI